MKIWNLLLCAFLPILTTPALADAGHENGKGFTFGSPGKESEVTRTVNVQAADTMRFDPSKLQVKQGETVKFVIGNVGRLKHEFTLGDRATQRAHATMMKKMPNMKHEDDATTVSLEPGQTKALIWKFDKRPAAPIEIACHEPGHYEAGMKIAVVLPR
jgi:uncharacterized cupredoxin-like copper-binding protein